MYAVIVVLRLLAISQVTLFASYIALSRNPIGLRIAGVLLAICVVAYLALPLVLEHMQITWIARVLTVGSDAIPIMLVLFVWALFEDDVRVPMWLRVMISGYLSLLVLAQVDPELSIDSRLFLLFVLYQILKIAIAISAIVIVLSGRENDLVEARLVLRRYFAVSLSLAVVAVVTTEVISGWQVPTIIEVLGMALIFSLALVVNLAQARTEFPFFLMKPANTVVANNLSESNPLIDDLIQLMSEQRLYADHDLRISSVATRLGVAEHKLRRTINQKLGYRNFNQFINKYRIEEATQRLVTERENPILTIGLDVGFRSISSFNSAFRIQHDCAPSEYRRRALVHVKQTS